MSESKDQGAGEGKWAWGGPRVNSGRKPTLHNPVKKMVRLEEGQMEAIIEWSEERNVNINAAIREMVEFAHEAKLERQGRIDEKEENWEGADPKEQSEEPPF